MLIVDMKMPKSCDECPISNGFKIPCPYGIDDGAGYDMFQAYKVGKRPSWCPIKGELVRCGECKHRDPEDKRCDCGGHEWVKGKILPVEDDWFCADGERKDVEHERRQL